MDLVADQNTSGMSVFVAALPVQATNVILLGIQTTAAVIGDFRELTPLVCALRSPPEPAGRARSNAAMGGPEYRY